VVLQIFTLYYLMDYIKIENPTEVAGDLMVVVGVSILVMVYPAGWLTDRIGRKPVVISSGLVGALGIVCLYPAWSALWESSACIFPTATYLYCCQEPSSG